MLKPKLSSSTCKPKQVRCHYVNWFVGLYWMVEESQKGPHHWICLHNWLMMWCLYWPLHQQPLWLVLPWDVHWNCTRKLIEVYWAMNHTLSTNDIMLGAHLWVSWNNGLISSWLQLLWWRSSVLIWVGLHFCLGVLVCNVMRIHFSRIVRTQSNGK